MTLFNIVAIAVALAMDAFAVAIAVGIKMGSVSFRQNFRLAWHFGLFQALMPAIGWLAGLTIRHQMAEYGHWLAVGLLLFVAQGMLRQAFKREKENSLNNDPTKGTTMVMLSVATSVDALAVGIGLSMIVSTIWQPAIIIGAVAFIFTTVGMHVGKRISRATQVRRYADFLGAAVLIIIGINILRQHGML